jgi:hypothetical protein
MENQAKLYFYEFFSKYSELGENISDENSGTDQTEKCVFVAMVK